jgi:two-component system chemotaxis sensor kinase CheA
MMPLSDKMQKELMATFQKELEEHISTFNKGLLALERNSAPEERENVLMGIFRAAHSLKGASRFVNLKDIETIAHRMEDALGIVRKEHSVLSPEHIDIFLQSTDTIGEAMAAHLRGEKVAEEHMNTVLSRLDNFISSAKKQGSTKESGSSEPSAVPTLDSILKVDSGEAAAEASSGAEIAADPVASYVATQSETLPSSANQQQISMHPITSEDTIRVATTKLDALMDSLGELMVVRMHTEQFLDQTKVLQQRVTNWQKNWRKTRPHYNRFRRNKTQSHNPDLARLLDFIESSEQEMKAIGAELNKLTGNLKNDRGYLHLVIDDLHNGIRNARMLPIATLFDIFPRMIRDLARDFGKDIVLEMTGQETELDRQALEMIKDPLLHILRNAIDHGIEPPEERLSRGKSRYGTIRMCAEQRGNNLVMTVSDDGRGIDLDAVRRSAVQHNLIPAEKASELNDREIIELIFFSGLSTAKQVSNISGRGVGMDVVRENLEQMRGLIQVETTYGLGTTFILMMPLTLATSQVVLMRIAGETVALPMMNVERMLNITSNQIGSIEGHPVIYAEGRSLPLMNLAYILGLREAEQPLQPDAKIPVVIISVIEKRIALRVDAFLSTQQIVIKSLGKQLRRVRNIAGVTVLGDGRLVTVLNVSDIIRSINVRSVASQTLPVIAQKISRRRVLVVDDSITTRTLEKHILENAGYEVSALVDGQEAWEHICSSGITPPDMVVSDIDMPRMDGFILARTIKGDNRYSHIPVVLVTSLDSQQDRLRGMEEGADAYIVKSTFDQRELLEAIERLIR